MATAKKPATTTVVVATKPKAPAKKAVAVSAPALAPAAETQVVVKKAPAKKAALPKVAAQASSSAATPAESKATRPAVTHEQRHNYIEVAAFYVAQRRGFAPGNPVDDWAMAEQEVDLLIESGHFSK